MPNLFCFLLSKLTSTNGCSVLLFFGVLFLKNFSSILCLRINRSRQLGMTWQLPNVGKMTIIAPLFEMKPLAENVSKKFRSTHLKFRCVDLNTEWSQGCRLWIWTCHQSNTAAATSENLWLLLSNRKDSQDQIQDGCVGKKQRWTQGSRTTPASIKLLRHYKTYIQCNMIYTDAVFTVWDHDFSVKCLQLSRHFPPVV